MTIPRGGKPSPERRIESLEVKKQRKNDAHLSTSSSSPSFLLVTALSDETPVTPTRQGASKSSAAAEAAEAAASSLARLSLSGDDDDEDAKAAAEAAALELELEDLDLGISPDPTAIAAGAGGAVDGANTSDDFDLRT